MDYAELVGICRCGGKSWAKGLALVDGISPNDKPITHCGKPKLKPFENGRIPRIPDDVLAKLKEEEKKILLTNLFEDADASVDHIRKNWHLIMAEHLRRENELAEKLKGYWNLKN